MCRPPSANPAPLRWSTQAWGRSEEKPDKPQNEHKLCSTSRHRCAENAPMSPVISGLPPPYSFLKSRRSLLNRPILPSELRAELVPPSPAFHSPVDLVPTIYFPTLRFTQTAARTSCQPNKRQYLSHSAVVETRMFSRSCTINSCIPYNRLQASTNSPSSACGTSHVGVLIYQEKKV